MRIVFLLACLLWCMASATAGSVVVIGGALRDDNHAVWERVVALAGGPGARFAVFATAAEAPEAAAAAIVTNLQRHGAVAEVVQVAPGLAGIDIDAAVRDPRWINLLRASQGVFFSGGAQARLVDTLQPGGKATPLLEAVRALFERGGVVAGTSAGAAVLSATMFRDAPDLLQAMRAPLRDGIEVDRGFGLLPPQVVADQHFVRRGRIRRLLPLLVSRGLPLGLGVEEDSAAVVQGTHVDVIGARGAIVVDLGDAAPKTSFAVQGARVHWLAAGDGFDLATRRVLAPSAGRRPVPSAAAAAMANTALNSRDDFHADMLGEGVFVATMTQLVNGPRQQALGLAFDLRSPLAFEWRLYKAADTVAWAAMAGDDCTVANLRLDVTPVRMAQPLTTTQPP